MRVRSRWCATDSRARSGDWLDANRLVGYSVLVVALFLVVGGAAIAVGRGCAMA